MARKSRNVHLADKTKYGTLAPSCTTMSNMMHTRNGEGGGDVAPHIQQHIKQHCHMVLAVRTTKQVAKGETLLIHYNPRQGIQSWAGVFKCRCCRCRGICGADSVGAVEQAGGEERGREERGERERGERRAERGERGEGRGELVFIPTKHTRGYLLLADSRVLTSRCSLRLYYSVFTTVSLLQCLYYCVFTTEFNM
jgi:hypothetical protein